MHITPTRLAIVVLALAFAGGLLAIAPRELLVWIAASGLVLLASAALILAPHSEVRTEDSERIESLTIVRRAELVRGTSLQLREMRYRYSVRHDERGRVAFSTRLNQIRLGFVPVIITDNETDAQGLGYVAFVHDGHRWRGPGLPCAGSAEDALAGAARHVDPLRDIEDTGDTGDTSADDEGDFDDDAPDGDGHDDRPDDDDDGDFGPDGKSRWDTGSGWDDDSEPGDGGART